jgi:hypothetical protein
MVAFQMKGVFRLSLAALCALAFVEIVIAKIVGFPTYGCEYKMQGIRGTNRSVTIYKPYSRYWIVEGGNRVFRRNNLGFTGNDVQVRRESKYIFVVGSSFIEACQVNPDRMAVSVFQSELNKNCPKYQVLNLGVSDHDPYDLYWRSSYFESKYYPSKIILVIDPTSQDWLRRHPHPLRFDNGIKTPQKDRSKIVNCRINIVNSSSFMNLLKDAVAHLALEKAKLTQSDSVGKVKMETSKSDLIAIVSSFYHKYGDRFSVISLNHWQGEHSQLLKYCEKNKITYTKANILLPQYRIDGIGHFNEIGNKLLGEILYENFCQNHKE